MRYRDVLWGVVVFALLAGPGWASSPDTIGAPTGVEASRRRSECGFRVVLRTGTTQPDVAASDVLDTAAEIARRTRGVSIMGTYAREEAVNDFPGLKAVAIRHAGTVRDMLVARGVPPDSIWLRGLNSSHPEASQSGAEIFVCGPNRNGWREDRVDPRLLVRVRPAGQPDAPVLHVPIVHLASLAWGNYPVSDVTTTHLYLDRADDPATFAEVTFRCRETDADADCARKIRLHFVPSTGRLELSRDDRSGAFDPVSRRTARGRLGEERVLMTRRWSEDATSIASIDCGPYVRANKFQPARLPHDPLVCRADLLIGPASLHVSVAFTTIRDAEALDVVDRTRRDLMRFARAGSVQ